MAIRSVKNDNCHVLTDKNSKFLFYNFSNYLKRRGLSMQYVRHTIISEDVHGLLELQKRNTSCFIGKLFKLSEGDDFELEHLGTEADIEEKELLLNTITNL